MNRKQLNVTMCAENGEILQRLVIPNREMTRGASFFWAAFAKMFDFYGMSAHLKYDAKNDRVSLTVNNGSKLEPRKTDAYLDGTDFREFVFFWGKVFEAIAFNEKYRIEIEHDPAFGEVIMTRERVKESSPEE